MIDFNIGLGGVVLPLSLDLLGSLMGRADPTAGPAPAAPALATQA